MSVSVRGPVRSRAFLKLTVALVIIGFAQKPTLRTQPKVRYRKREAVCSPNWSPIRPITTGTTAPPIIPVLRMPVKGPVVLRHGVQREETRIGHITEANRPTAGMGNYRDLRRSEQSRRKAEHVPRQVPISTLRLSKIFNNPIPMKQPAVNSPQSGRPRLDDCLVCGIQRP